MIEVKQVSLRLGKRQILRGIDLCAMPGEITVLLGRNGSGKTSLIRCIVGTQERYTGEIFLDSIPLRNLRPSERAHKISLLPQVLPRPPISVLQLAAFGRQPYAGLGGKLGEADLTRAQKAVEQAGLAAHWSDLVCHLSGGERQLAFFALLLAQDTPFVLLDEPTASLDTEYRRMVYQLLRQMRSTGKTIVVILHDLADAVELADRIAVLNHGQNAFFGTPEEFIQSDVPLLIFGLHPKRVTDPQGTVYTIFRPI